MHSSSFQALALVSEPATAVRSHPTSDAELHGQLLCSIFSILTLQPSSPKATSAQEPSTNNAKLAVAGLGNAW